MISQFQPVSGVLPALLRARLLALPGVNSSWKGRERVQVLDTFDHRLEASGLALEARHTAAGELKLVLDTRHGASRESIAAGALPRTAADLSQPRLRQRLLQLTAGRALLPLALGSLHCERFECHDPHGKLIARLELRQALTPPRPVVLGLHAVAGFELQAARLIDVLCEETLVIPLEEPAPGYLLRALGRQPAPYLAKPVLEFEPEEHATPALARLLHSYTGVMRANEAGLIARLDTEFLHDYRVALRSLRSWLVDLKSALSGETREVFRKALGTLNRETSALRDLDVLSLALPRYVAESGLPESPALEALRTRLDSRHNAARQRLNRHLRSAAYRGFLRRWERFLTECDAHRHRGRRGDWPIRRLVVRALRQRLAVVVAFVPAAARADAGVLHELRKECKKLRYLLEGFQRLFNRDTLRAAVRELKTLQEAMGDIRDLHVHVTLLREMVEPDSAGETLMAGLASRLEAEEAHRTEAVLAAYRRFRGPRVQQLYARLMEEGPG